MAAALQHERGLHGVAGCGVYRDSGRSGCRKMRHIAGRVRAMARAQDFQGGDPIVEARRAFFEAGRTPVGQVPGAILQSWRRCRSLGLAADRRPAIEPGGDARLREMREQHERLWRLARAEIEMLASDAATTGSIAILTDADGWILDAAGSTGFLRASIGAPRAGGGGGGGASSRGP